MKVERFSVRSGCQSCTTTSVALKLGKPLSADFLAFLVGKGYSEVKQFTKVSILYVENEALIATGAMGSNILQIRCKKRDCVSFINALEEFIATME